MPPRPAYDAKIEPMMGLGFANCPLRKGYCCPASAKKVAVRTSAHARRSDSGVGAADWLAAAVEGLPSAATPSIDGARTRAASLATNKSSANSRPPSGADVPTGRPTTQVRPFRPPKMERGRSRDRFRRQWRGQCPWRSTLRPTGGSQIGWQRR